MVASLCISITSQYDSARLQQNLEHDCVSHTAAFFEVIWLVPADIPVLILSKHLHQCALLFFNQLGCIRRGNPPHHEGRKRPFFAWWSPLLLHQNFWVSLYFIYGVRSLNSLRYIVFVFIYLPHQSTSDLGTSRISAEGVLGPWYRDTAVDPLGGVSGLDLWILNPESLFKLFLSPHQNIGHFIMDLEPFLNSIFRRGVLGL